MCPQCQRDAKFQCYTDKTCESLLGPVRLSRPYYYCPTCRAGIFPWDEILRLPARKVTPAAADVTTLAGTLGDFGGASHVLARLSGIKLSESSVRRITEDSGTRLAAATDRGECFEPPEDWKWGRDAHGKRCGYVSIDGIHVPMQGPGGTRAETRVEYVGRLYNHQGGSAAPAGPHQTDTRYVAGFQSLDEICRQLQQQHDRVGGEQVEHWLCLTDGGAGIADTLRRGFCWTTWILDFWHATEYLRPLAQALHPGDDAARRAWLEQWCHSLKHEGGRMVLGRLQELDQTGWGAAAREAWTDVVRYYGNQLEGMDYPCYIANGWQIGSGPIEAACKTVVATRLKHSGMRWVTPGADPVSRLRALYLNGPAAWDHFWASPN